MAAGQSGTVQSFESRETVINIEVLAGTGNIEGARSLVERLLKYDRSPETRALVETHLARAGRPELIETVPSR
jgi:hypothetical protein